MARTLTRQKFKELQEAYDTNDQQFVEKLEDYTGITREPYTCYSYYDDCGDYIGDSDDFDLYCLLSNAGIDIVDKVKTCAVCGAPYVGRCCHNCGSSDVED